MNALELVADGFDQHVAFAKQFFGTDFTKNDSGLSAFLYMQRYA